jgi:anti-sigma regulatory factor (Ser/Thr protein kinase)
MSGRLELTLENRLAAIAGALAEIRRFCEPLNVSRREIHQVSLAIDELLSNIIAYAWPEGGEHTIRLVLGVADGSLTAELIDDGIPFDPRAVPEPDRSTPLEERRVGGLGVYFAMTLMDGVEYRRVGNENHLTLIKTIPAMESQRD